MIEALFLAEGDAGRIAADAKLEAIARYLKSGSGLAFARKHLW